MNHHFLLVVHLMAACVWVGGHLLLTVKYLPKALKSKNPQIIRDFEKHYEPIGLPSLLVLIATGVCMAYDYGVTVSHWFSFSEPLEKVVSIKMLLMFSTLLLAVHARLYIIPSLSADKLKQMAVHIILITTIGVAMLILGTFVRFGGL